MIIYDSTKEGFMKDVESGEIADRISDRCKTRFGKPSPSEYRSWENSMEYMYKVLNYNELPNNTGVAIEYNIPLTSKRIDFILSGCSSNHKAAVIIELKQWQKIEKITGKDGIVKTYLGGGIRETTHPSYQALSYKNLIEDFIESIETENIGLYPCAFLHNYKLTANDPIIDTDVYGEYVKYAPVFGKTDVEKLRSFINEYIKYGDNKDIIYHIQNGKIRPSKRLQDTLLNMLKGNKEFMMIDEQKIVYESAKQMALSSAKDNKKRVLVVKGGPGTGKSVVAINLLVEFINNKMVSQYVTKNSAPRDVFFKKLKGEYTQEYVKNLFKSSGTYMNSEKNTFDSLIIDEAHRLNEKSGFYGNQGENQIKEIINASKSSIFFIDEYQRVTMKDIGDIQTIKHFAKEFDAEYQEMKLESQFRCNGSDGYLSWLNNVLGIEKTANFDWEDNFNYEFKVVDNPLELKEIIYNKNKRNNKSRLLAGYCWNWDSKNKANPNVYDISIPEEGFEMSWNLNNELWAIGETSIDQVGCIHTSQGLEFDYVGVIIGEDMKYEDGKIITDLFKRAKTDQSLKGIKTLYKKEPEKAVKVADEIIKNTYRTLMTRGMKGCYIYCVDEDLQEYFKGKKPI